MKVLKFIFLGLMAYISNAQGEEVYFLNNLKNCQIEMYQEKSFISVDQTPFINVVLDVKEVPKKPEYVAFKSNDRIYVTRSICVMPANQKEIDNKLTGNEYRRKNQDLSEREKFNSYKYFAEFETGIVNISSSNPVIGNYNNAVPTVSGSDLVWGATEKGDYSTGALINLGFGFRSTHERFIVFKMRFFSGKKTDSVALIDTITSDSTQTNWSYKDSFKNFYLGYKYIFRDHSAWKPTFGFYLGLSQMTSNFTNGTEGYSLSSLAPAALLEGGIEYHLNSHWGLGANLGFEYLGKRSMKFEAEAGPKFKTEMNYNNQYFAFGVKYYFK